MVFLEVFKEAKAWFFLVQYKDKKQLLLHKSVWS